MKFFSTTCLLFWAILSTAQTEKIQKIDSIFNSKISENDPALFVGIVKDGNIIYENIKGLESLQHQSKASENTVSNIASVTKQFTALMVLQLSLENKLSLEDDIRQYLPELYPEVNEDIKIRHLINHTSGIRDYCDLMGLQQNPWWRREGLDNADVIDLIAKQKELAFEPGSMKVYSNSGYNLLAKIVEVASGKDFVEYSKAFFEGLGMKNTFFIKSYMQVIPNHALPYSDWGDGIWKQYPMLTSTYGEGFLFTTLKDQLIFEKAIQNAKKTENALLIESQKPIPNSEITHYGFGLELKDKLGRKAVHHSGATGSYHAQTLRFPDDNLSIFVMSNNSRLWSGFVADELAKVLLPEEEEKIKYDNRITEGLELNSKDDIIGQYRSPEGYMIRIEKSEDGKYLSKNANNSPIALSYENRNIYSFDLNPKIKTGLFKDELIRFYPSGKTIVYKKEVVEKASETDIHSYTGEYYSDEMDQLFIIVTDEENKLKLTMKGRKRDRIFDIEVINRDELLAGDYILKVVRAPFDRVEDLLLTTSRVLNNRFKKLTNKGFQKEIQTENGSIQVNTIGSKNGKGSNILLTKNLSNGNEEWFKVFGGKSYDKASSIISLTDGYLIVGSTSSYGAGNYDVLVLKTDKKGKKLWQRIYGKFYNDFGYTAEINENGFVIKGTSQTCEGNSDINRKCEDKVWLINIDNKGNELSSQLGEIYMR
jgi:CubicO group peptidase (beta-lactamase class C family)